MAQTTGLNTATSAATGGASKSKASLLTNDQKKLMMIKA